MQSVDQKISGVPFA